MDRCMRRDRLNEPGVAAIEFAWPRFLQKDPSPESQKKIDELAPKLDALYVERRPPRPFLGDDTLPPGRYYSVAKDASGRDGFTIRLVRALACNRLPARRSGSQPRALPLQTVYDLPSIDTRRKRPRG
jgi:hypothetical protein